MGIKIVSYGPSGHDVKVFESKTGKEIGGIVHLAVYLRPGEKNEACLTVRVDSLQLEAEDIKTRKEMKCGVCGALNLTKEASDGG